MTIAALPDFIKKDVPIAAETYYHIGGTARWFALPRSLTEVQQSLQFAKTHQLPIAVFGTGSNSVFADAEFDGLLISMGQLNAWFWETDTVLYAEAGVSNTELAEVCLEAGRHGASWMYRMPGQLGATVRMNARCYGGEISQIVLHVVTMDTDGHLKTYDAATVFQGYKSTRLMTQPEIVVAVRIRLPSTAPRGELLAHMLQCERDRHGKHHFDFPSCGSTFKNNYAVGKPSGQVFDELGLKGFACGGAEVSQFHANFLWNKTGHATANEMLTVAGHMRQTALKQRGYELELEVQPIGRFEKQVYARCGMEKLGPAFEASQKEAWVGLLDFPQGNAAHKKVEYPVEVMASPYLEYTRKPLSGIDSIVASLEQLMSLEDAQKNPHHPFLRWTNRLLNEGKAAFSFEPAAASGSFVDELWLYSVAEIFFAEPEERKQYFEFEQTPHQHWIALRFSDRRVRTKGFEKLDASHWQGVKKFRHANGDFGFEFTYQQLASTISHKSVAVQCMLSLGNARYFLSPHWKQFETATETWDFAHQPPTLQYDFHQPKRFTLVNLY